MNNRRRRANDFTDSLTSFRQTFIEDQSQTLSQAYSEDSLDIGSTKGKQHDNNNQWKYAQNKSRTGSIILAGHLASEHSISLPESLENAYKDTRPTLSKDINVSDETSYMPLKLDLNKCINLFQNECLIKKSTAKEVSSSASEIRRNVNIPHFHENKNVEVQCNLCRDCPRSMSLSSLRCISSPIYEIRRSQSCVTFNDNVKMGVDSGAKAELRPSANREASLNIQILISPCKRDSTSSERSSKGELNPSELRAFLSSLKDQTPWKEEAMVQKPLLRRMSANFCDAPRNFTEQLLTIIEESVINNDTSGVLEYPEISLCRLTEELRKMCKFIEDETVPEWPGSPNMSTRNGRKYSKGCQEGLSQLDCSRKFLDAATPNKDPFATPTPTRRLKSPKKLYRPKISAKSPKLHDSTSTFESLEAYCKQLYPNESRFLSKEGWSQSPLRDMKRILLTCGNQMASLDSPNIYEQLKKAATSTVDLVHKPDAIPETQAPQCNSLTQEKRDEAGSKSISDVLRSKQQAESSKCCEMINPDDLEDTLMYEIAKKRQRCLDTAKVMHEIDASSEPVSSGTAEAQQDPSSAVVELQNINDSKFMETLMTVKRYQDYLEGYKPLLNLFQSRSSTSRSSCGEKVVKRASKAHLAPPKSPMTRKKSPSPRRSLKPVVISKPRLFVTPGKTPVKPTCTKQKRTYFPNLITGASKQRRDISPHEKNVYRQIGSYDHVISPVGMYIRSTNPSLVKNVRPKTNEMLLTPRKQAASSSASPKPRMKLRLSPKEPKEEAAGAAGKDQNVADNFFHPKVHYQLPSHVRTIKETEGRKVGNRMNELLRTTQDKVVIRHEGRAKSVRTDCSEEQPEIHYTSAEESVHIEQTARKTQFSRI